MKGLAQGSHLLKAFSGCHVESRLEGSQSRGQRADAVVWMGDAPQHRKEALESPQDVGGKMPCGNESRACCPPCPAAPSPPQGLLGSCLDTF